MLLDTPADIGLDSPDRAGRMMRFARAVRTRWRTLSLVTGAVLTVLGVVLASGAVLLPGILLLAFALLHGIGSSGCTSADLLAGCPGTGKTASMRGQALRRAFRDCSPQCGPLSVAGRDLAGYPGHAAATVSTGAVSSLSW